MSVEKPRPSALKIVIIGGVAGGASAAARTRRLHEQAEIVVLERGPDASFANCGLPYYVGGEIKDRGKLLVAGDRQLRDWLRLQVRTRAEVTAIDREAQRVTVHDLDRGTSYEEEYDYLILSPGAAPIRPTSLLEQTGPHHPRVLSLRNMADVDRLKERVDDGIQSAVVVGGGFIGLEMCEQLIHRGIPTRLVEQAPHVMPSLDQEMAQPVHHELQEKGVELYLANGVKSLRPAGEQLAVELQDGTQLETELVLLAIGVRPDTELARAAGLELTSRGAIRVNASHQTSDPRIYAVGDAVEVLEPIYGSSTYVPLGGPANRQGRLVADHVAHREGSEAFHAEALRYRGTQGTSIVRVFGLNAASTGLGEKALHELGKQRGGDYGVVYAHPPSHAGYYPGSSPIALKLIYEKPSGRVLGAQAVGPQGVDKRIDVIAMAIQTKATVFDLEQAELCYAPPFGSAKDPVNLVGFIAANALRGLTFPAHVNDLPLLDDQRPITLLDVRTAKEFDRGSIHGAIHLPLEELRDRFAEVPRDKPIVVFCHSGLRGYLAERILRQSGCTDVSNLSGGFTTWRQFQAS